MAMKAMNLQAAAALSTAATLILSWGCTKPKHAVTQETTLLPLPTYDSSGQPPFMLSSGSGQLTYQSNLLIWDPGVSVDQIQKISDQSVSTRVASAALLKYAAALGVPALVKQQKAAAAQLDSLKKAESVEAASRTGAVAAAVRPTLTTWFDARTASLSADDKTAATGVFKVYCEAKLWELAANPLLAHSYAARPTPLEICEPTLAAAKLLDVTTAECAPAAAGATKNYLDCFWKQGVLKTSIYTARVAQDATVDVCKDKHTEATARIAAWVSGGQLQAALLKDFASTDPAVQFRLWTIIGAAPAALPDDYAFAADCPTAFFHDPNATEWNTNDVINLNNQLSPPAIGPLAGLPLQPLATILAAVEAPVSGDNSTLNYTLLPVGASETPAQTAARYAQLADDIRALAARPPVAPTPTAVVLSPNDYWLNWAPGATGYSSPAKDAVLAKPAFAATAAALAQIPSTDFATPEAKAQATIDQTQAKVDKDSAAVQTEIQKKGGVNDQKGQSATTAAANGISLLLANVVLTETRKGDNLETRLKIGPAKRSVVGCVTTQASRCDAVPQLGDEGALAFSYMKFDQDANELIVEIPVTDPEELGLVFPSVPDYSVAKLTAAQLTGLTLHLEAYANKLDGVLDFFTGNAELRDASGTAVYSGSLAGSALNDDLVQLDVVH